jgi:acyl carrier protein
MVTTREHLLDEVSRIVGEILNDKSIHLKYETTANDITDWDSLNHIEIIVAIEKYFKIKFNFAELQKFKNVG